MKSKIFINYRKDDSPWNSLALYQELIKHFGKENIFKDLNTILPGTDFIESIEDALESCDVLLVLISEHWLDIKDKNGNRRINNPDDFVRIEIASALRRNIKVIPVLFDNAVLPAASELPEDLKKLSHRQSIEIDKTRFDADTARLVATIKSILQATAKKTEPETGTENTVTPTPDDEFFLPGNRSRPRKGIVIILVLLAIVVVAYFLGLFGNKEKKDDATALTQIDTSAITIDTAVKKPAIQADDTVLPFTEEADPSKTTTTQNPEIKKDDHDEEVTVTSKKSFNDFQEAYVAAFKDASSGFVHFTGDGVTGRRPAPGNYKTMVNIRDSSIKIRGITLRDTLWMLGFGIKGPAVNGRARSAEIDKAIQSTFSRNSLRFVKAPINSSRTGNSLQATEYRATRYRVDFYRIISKGTYQYTVLIYYSPG